MEGEAQANRKIFISIASFCDPLLLFTVRSALENARYPQQLAFGIVDQNPSSNESELPVGGWRMAYLHIDPLQSRGTCWARALAMTLYFEEDYFLQIDSHTCFDPDWDITLVEVVESIAARTGNERIILSSRPFPFEIEADGSVRKDRFTANTLELVPNLKRIDASQPILRFDSYGTSVTDDLPGFQVSGNFLFSQSLVVTEIPYDPFLYFEGEEQNFSMRAYTHGWDIWHPNRIPLAHLYKTGNGPRPALHWDAEIDARRREKWHEFKDRADDRLIRLIGGGDLGVYGLGSRRRLEDYFSALGVSVEIGNLSVGAERGERSGG